MDDIVDMTWSPVERLTESTTAGAGLGGKNPSITRPLYGPNPVPSNDSVSPALAGLSGVTTDPSSCSASAYCCEFKVWKNRPGELRATEKVAEMSSWSVL